MSRRSWIYIDGKAYEKGVDVLPETGPSAPLIVGDIEPFVSPITKEVIRGRSHLRRHMKEHGVTHMSDYSPDWLKTRRAQLQRQQEEANRRDRIELIKRQLER